MSTKIKIALASLLLLASTGIASAAPRGAGGHGGRDRADMILAADKNKDGKLDDAERAAMRAAHKADREAHRAQMLSKYDGNRDGKLDDAERAKVRAERVDEHFRQLDSNGDGVISKAEFQAQAAARASKHGPGMRGHGKRGHGKRGGL